MSYNIIKYFCAGINKSLIKNSAIMSLSILLGGFISLLSLPLISRAYSPNAFGVFGFVISASTVLSVFFTMRTEYVIPIIEDINNVRRISKESINRTLILSGALLLLIALMKNVIGSSFGNLTAFEVFLGVFLSIFTAYFSLGRAIHQRLDRFAVIGLARVLRPAIFLCCALLFANMTSNLGAPPASALILATACSLVLSALLQHLTLPHAFQIALLPGPLKAPIMQRDERKKSRIAAWTFVIAQMCYQFPIWVAMVKYGPWAAGLIAMSYRLFTFPADLLGNGFGVVLVRRISNGIAASSHQLATDRRILAAFFICVFGTFACLAVALYFLSGPLLGDEWRGSGGAIGATAFVGLAFTIQPIAFQILALFNREKMTLILTIAHAGALLIGSMLAIVTDANFTQAVACLAIIEATISIFISIYILHITKQNLKMEY